jgi:UDPglucose 6-dehydrogenase
MINSIGIVGQGFVGTAVNVGLSKYFKVETFDIIPEKSTVNGLSELYYTTDIIFVCLPTPMRKSGECDISIVEKVISELNSFGNTKIVILKSTVPPGTCELLQKKYKNIDLIFNPEFLTEANAVNDFINQDRIVLGGHSKLALSETYAMFRRVFPDVSIIKTDTKSAEMVKYITNCFLSVKVSFANQIFDICSSIGIDYSIVSSIAKLDNRLGDSHWKVPGPDGDRGYGGHCFPKDMSAFLYFSEKNDIDQSIIRESIKYNDKIRSDRNWENMVGRAVSED